MTNLAEPTVPVIERRFCAYYYALKEVYRLHIENGFGRSPDIPSGFSEALCRQVLGLSKCDGRDYDAVCSDGLRYEIKATGTPEGQTTISKSSEFDVLVWLVIDFQNDAVHITEIPYAAFDLQGGDGRQPVRLSRIANQHQLRPETYLFTRRRIRVGRIGRIRSIGRVGVLWRVGCWSREGAEGC